MKLKLPTVTLICVTGVNYKDSIYALWRSSKNVDFASIKIVSPEIPEKLINNIQHEFPFESSLKNIDDYSKYIIYNLWRHVDTEHCLLIQADGYVINPKMWNDKFLKYDYIGAPWPISDKAYIDPFGNHQQVGNGGFSLRSKKLLLVPNKTHIPWEVNKSSFYKHMEAGLYSEDGNICVHNRHIYENVGCMWAPLELACTFSIETTIPENISIKTFGYHKQLPSKFLQFREQLNKLLFIFITIGVNRKLFYWRKFLR